MQDCIRWDTSSRLAIKDEADLSESPLLIPSGLLRRGIFASLNLIGRAYDKVLYACQAQAQAQAPAKAQSSSVDNSSSLMEMQPSSAARDRTGRNLVLVPADSAKSNRIMQVDYRHAGSERVHSL